MTIKAERHLYVECDSCDTQHAERSLSTYGARVKAGASGWTLTEDRDEDDKLVKRDLCPECTERWSSGGQVQRGVPQGGDEAAAREETG